MQLAGKRLKFDVPNAVYDNKCGSTGDNLDKHFFALLVKILHLQEFAEFLLHLFDNERRTCWQQACVKDSSVRHGCNGLAVLRAST